MNLPLVLAFSMGANAQLPSQAASPKLESAPPLWGNLHAGTHAVGFRTIFRYDNSRTWKSTRRYDGTFLPDLKGRPTQINIWYPASPDESMRKMHFGDYVDQSAPGDFAELNTIMKQRSRDDAVGAVPRNEIPQLQSSEMNAYHDAPWANGVFPTVLYFAGLNAPINSNAILAEYLASRGYIVASISVTRTIRRTNVSVANSRRLGIVGPGHGVRVVHSANGAKHRQKQTCGHGTQRRRHRSGHPGIAQR